LAVCCLSLVAAVPARAAPDAARLADSIAERWVALQRPDATFPDSIRPDTHTWGRYGQAGVGYGLMLAGIRSGRPAWIEAGARAQAYAAERALDHSSVFENMLIASGYNLLRLRAPATPTFAARRALWESYLRSIEPVNNPLMDVPLLPSNKYLVEALEYFELARSELRSSVPGTVLHERGRGRRRGLDIVNRLVPKRVRTLRGQARGHRVTALSDRTTEPLAYHSLTIALLARAIDVAGRGVSRGARAALRIGVRSIWAFQGPDGDLAYFGRSQGQSWALALANYAAARAASGGCGRRARAYRAVAERAIGRLAALYPIGPTGIAIVPAADGPATIPAIDDYASEVVYNGLTLTALGWTADRAAGAAACRSGGLLSDRPHGFALLPFEAARFATLRHGRVWMAVKLRSQRRDGRAAFGVRALKRRDDSGAWADLAPAAPAVTGRPSGSFGPALRLRSGALARPRGTRIDVRRRRIVVRGGWMRAGRWVRRGVRFRFTPTARGARIDVSTRKDDRLVYAALTEGPPEQRPRGVADAVAVTHASGPVRVGSLGPFASSSSLSVWRSDLTLRATGRRAWFRVSAR
jgi:hypothetical protein